MNYPRRQLSRTIALVQREYLRSRNPWFLGYSGGKDSSALLKLLIGEPFFHSASVDSIPVDYRSGVANLTRENPILSSCGKILIGSRYSKALSVFIVGVCAFVASALVSLVVGIREPRVHDEFSYLLAADTFAHGRLTNPTHPMWIHLETFHVIHEPTYMSKYQPAQGFVLAVGQVLSGYPIVGVWLAMALMCAAVCWMLQAWLPPRWALLGGLLTIIHPYIGVGGYYAQSYWGGAVPALGGALLLGSWRHLERQARANVAFAGALGLVIMANSRPYEGLVLSVPVVLGLVTWLMGTRKPPLGLAVRNVILPFALIGVLAFSFMGYYNYRVAGDVFRLPYQVHEKAYDMFAYFVWQDLPSEPDYRHSVIREFHADYEMPHYVDKQTLKGFVSATFGVFMLCLLLIGNVFLVPVIGSARALMAWSWKDCWGRRAILVYVFFALGLSLETIMSLHYWAPITALTYYFIVQGLRMWRAQSPRIGRVVLYAVPALAVVVFGINVVQSRIHPLDWSRQRARLLDRLKQQVGQHLVLVKYGPEHSYEFEWVYNEADIDGSKVVWARAMDVNEDCELVKYFKDRTIWSLEIDDDEAPIKPRAFQKQVCYSSHP